MPLNSKYKSAVRTFDAFHQTVLSGGHDAQHGPDGTYTLAMKRINHSRARARKLGKFRVADDSYVVSVKAGQADVVPALGLGRGTKISYGASVGHVEDLDTATDSQDVAKSDDMGVLVSLINLSERTIIFEPSFILSSASRQTLSRQFSKLSSLAL